MILKLLLAVVTTTSECGPIPPPPETRQCPVIEPVCVCNEQNKCWWIYFCVNKKKDSK